MTTTCEEKGWLEVCYNYIKWKAPVTGVRSWNFSIREL